MKIASLALLSLLALSAPALAEEPSGLGTLLGALLGASGPAAPAAAHPAEHRAAAPTDRDGRHAFADPAEHAGRMFLANWRTAVRRAELIGATAADACAKGDQTACGHRLWEYAMDELAGLSGFELVAGVNDAVNRLPYGSDAVVRGLPDYWSSPGEMFLDRAGDCEDYSIAKYLGLIRLGMAPEDVRALIVFVPGTGQYHIVVGARVGGQEFLLDNGGQVTRRVDQASEYRPVWALQGDRIAQVGRPPAPSETRGGEYVTPVAAARPERRERF